MPHTEKEVSRGWQSLVASLELFGKVALEMVEYPIMVSPLVEFLFPLTDDVID